MKPLDQAMIVELGMAAANEAFDAIIRKTGLVGRGGEKILLLGVALTVLAAKREGMAPFFKAAGISGLDDVVKQAGASGAKLADDLLAPFAEALR